MTITCYIEIESGAEIRIEAEVECSVSEYREGNDSIIDYDWTFCLSDWQDGITESQAQSLLDANEQKFVKKYLDKVEDDI
jgi:hypothetical protein